MKTDPASQKPASQPYKTDFRHHGNRRKRNHDYRAPWKYHITISKHPSASDFSTLVIKELTPAGVTVSLSPLGCIIEKEIKDFNTHHPKIAVLDHIVMPDHIHMLIQVRERLSKPVGTALGGLKTGISQIWREYIGNPDARVFDTGFNDKIIYSFRLLKDVSQYIRQNPYRLAVRRCRPDFFRKTRDLEIAGRKIQAYGNLFLFRNPFKTPLIVHRADSEQVFNDKKEACLTTAINGGVVVSAFISPREKEILKEVEAIGGRVIKIHHQPFGDRDKPALHDFERCAAGQLLLLSPADYATQPSCEHPTRAQCLDMNALATTLCTQPPDTDNLPKNKSVIYLS